jgi:ubiquinone/menaquinone biosynthesis C-methylase UbiE
MRSERDVAAFDERASGYEAGALGRMHREIVDRTCDLAVRLQPDPKMVLDIGCGTGYLLRTVGGRCRGAEQLAGIDPAPSMIEVAISSSRDDRIRFSTGVAEKLPFADDTFDLVVSTTSFDHWGGQEAGLRECARVLRSGGHLVLVDQFSLWLTPTLLYGRRGKARTTRRATRLLRNAGFRSLRWQRLYAVIIKAATATI